MMPIAGDSPIGPLQEGSDGREASGDGQRAKEWDLFGDLDPRGPGAAPATVPVPDMHRVTQGRCGRGIDDVVDVLKRHDVEASTGVQSMQESRGPGADPAVRVVQHEHPTARRAVRSWCFGRLLDRRVSCDEERTHVPAENEAIDQAAERTKW